MASSASDMKGFFRQRKKSGAVSKPSSSSSSKKNPKSKKSTSPTHAASFGSDIAQPPALVAHCGSLDLKDEYDQNENALRQFDMNMAYGPCVGMSRLARWERASSLGLNPPKDIEHLIRSAKVRPDSLWDGRI